MADILIVLLTMQFSSSCNMSEPYLYRICPKFVANICRVSGILPLSWACDDKGLPVFCNTLFWYSLSVIPTLIVLLGILREVLCPEGFVSVLDLFGIAQIVTLIILPSQIQCMRGIFKHVVENLNTFDDTLKGSITAKINLAICILSLMKCLESYLIIQGECTSNIILQLICSFVMFSNQLLLYYSVKSLNERFKTLNKYMEERIHQITTLTASQLTPGK